MIKQVIVGLGIASLAFSAASVAGEPELDNNNMYIYIKNAPTSERPIMVKSGAALKGSKYQGGNDITGAKTLVLRKGHEAVGDVFSKATPRVGNYTISYVKNGKDVNCTFAFNWGSNPGPVSGDDECRNLSYVPVMDPAGNIGDYSVQAHTLTFTVK
ncbi:MAG: hypothetical protein CMF50_04610 [Legionellales bacterium]|nr:hypothetical protein [Legionellales bacterium]|tara:strand:- start:3812 stop:4282 length:471 start_codon:yes stop_codon:yes gene_type:complete